MANTKISALPALTGANLAVDDVFPVVDTSAAATDKITVAELKLGIMPAPGPIGSTTPSSGAFTTLTTTGNATLGDAEATDTHAIKGATTLLANSASAALTVTQTGAGNAFVVEDSASTDSTPFVIDGTGVAFFGQSAPAVSGVPEAVNITNNGVTVAQNLLGLQYVGANAQAPEVNFYKARGTVGARAIVNSADEIAEFRFLAFDGTNYINSGSIRAEVDGTPGTNDMPGRLLLSTTADGASSPTERMRIDSAGNVGVGGTTNAFTKVGIGGTLPSSSNFSMGYEVFATIPSTSTTGTSGFRTDLYTQAASFTVTNIKHYQANQGSIGAGSAVTNQFGFFAESTLTGATNNYGFYSSIAAAANRWNFYAAGTADNYFAGLLYSNSLIRSMGGTATPAGGSVNTPIILSGSATVGIYFGSGAPTLTAAAGSIYLRTDGGASTRLYSTSGGGTWHAITSA